MQDLNSTKALGNYSLSIDGSELTMRSRSGNKIARKYYSSPGMAARVYKGITTESKLKRWLDRVSPGIVTAQDTPSGRVADALYSKRNPPKRGNRWRMDDGRIVTSEQLKRIYFGKLPSPSQRRMLGITKVKTMAKRKNPRTPINKASAIPKGKRAGDKFTKGGKTFVVVSYVRNGKRVRYARKI